MEPLSYSGTSFGQWFNSFKLEKQNKIYLDFVLDYYLPYVEHMQTGRAYVQTSHPESHPSVFSVHHLGLPLLIPSLIFHTSYLRYLSLMYMTEIKIFRHFKNNQTNKINLRQKPSISNYLSNEEINTETYGGF